MNVEEVNWARLKEPFNPEEIDWRIQRAGMTKDGKPYGMILAYLTARAVMDRLDEVFTISGWSDSYSFGPNGEILCSIATDFGTSWATKTDGAEQTKVESVKGGLSTAFKRAAVKYGVGRYLYDLKDTWAIFHNKGIYRVVIENKDYKWDPPPLPAWALPPKAT